MKISELNKVLKEMKNVVNYKDNETEIDARGQEFDPYYGGNVIKLKTTINDIEITMYKDIDKQKTIDKIAKESLGQFK